MAIKVFLTGATGFIGGSLLSLMLHTAPHGKYDITTLVRSASSSASLAALGVTPLLGSLEDFELLSNAAREADVVVHCADADSMVAIKALVAGLISKKQTTGERGILIHTSGTGELCDDARGDRASEDVYSDLDMGKILSIPITQLHKDVDSFILDSCSDNSFSAYIVCPPTIYGLGTGPFNKHSVQVPALIRAALDRGKAGTVGKGLNLWNHVHVQDLAAFFFLLLEKAVEGKAGPSLPEGGWFFVENGEYSAIDAANKIGQVLFEKKAVETQEVNQFSGEEVSKYLGSHGWLVFGGNSRCKAERSRQLGWQPTRSEFFECIEAEAEAILAAKK